MIKTKFKIYSYKGFTLVEVLVAAGILMLFMGGVFGFYQMGGKMFNSGSWRQSTQKEAEVLFAQLHQSLSSVVVASTIDNTKKLTTYPTSLGYLKGTLNMDTNPSLPKVILAYPVVKASIQGKPGCVMYYILRASQSDQYAKNHDSRYKNVCKLELIATNNISSGKGNEFISSIGGFPFVTGLNTGLFSALPQMFGFGSTSNFYKVDDVASITFNLSDASSTGGRVLTISMTCKYPKNNNATITLNTASGISKGISFQEF